ncbi:MAG TPA: DUF2892 domain-containing protein [Acidimicrobiales bacterium]|nr:DUF2892 domain-containing protein [Acidimicrobiales bacterium]
MTTTTRNQPTQGASTEGPPTPALADHRRRASINITPAERAGRIGLGLAAVVVGAILLAGASSVVAVVLEALLVAAGLDLVVTGATGHCPLYAKLGHVPASLRRTS